MMVMSSGLTWSDVSLRGGGSSNARMTITLWDNHPGARRPTTFNFLPSLVKVKVVVVVVMGLVVVVVVVVVV